MGGGEGARRFSLDRGDGGAIGDHRPADPREALAGPFQDEGAAMAGMVSSVISASRQLVLNSAYRLPISIAAALTICSMPAPTKLRTCSTSLVIRVISWPVWAWSW